MAKGVGVTPAPTLGIVTSIFGSSSTICSPAAGCDLCRGGASRHILDRSISRSTIGTSP
jgi:hypothetical protein